MNSDAAPPGGGNFATTRWSVVLAAGANNTQAGAALGELCRLYWYPLYAFVRRQGHDAHDAQDLTQEFFAVRHRRILAACALAGWLAWRKIAAAHHPKAGGSGVADTDAKQAQTITNP